MRPAFLATFAGFAVASSLWAARASAGACTVDTDCLDNGLACGTDVCTKAGACVPAGTDPGTCNTTSNCKCYGLLSVLCNPQSHSCTMTAADGGLNKGGGATSGGGAASGASGQSGGGGSGGMGASGTIGSDDAGTTSDMDAGASQATSGSTVAMSGTVTGGPGTGSSSSTGASMGGPTLSGSGNAASGNTGGSGASAGSTEGGAKTSKSGCTVGFGDTPMPAGMLGIAVGAWVLLGRRRRGRGCTPLGGT